MNQPDLFPDDLPPRRIGSRGQGVHGAGQPTFKPEQREAVVRALLDADGPLSVESLSDITGVPGRAVRAIVSAADGECFVLGGDMNGGYVLAKSVEEAERLSRRLGSQIGQMARRLSRRRRKAREQFGERP